MEDNYDANISAIGNEAVTYLQYLTGSIHFLLLTTFSAVNKSFKTLENEEGLRRCKEIVDEAQDRVAENVS